MEYLKTNASYREIGGPDGLLARGIPFNGNSMSARTIGPDTAERIGKAYVVYSYATEIAAVSPDGEQTFNDRHYSPTTSRQQNLCHAWLWGREKGDQQVSASYPGASGNDEPDERHDYSA